MALPDPVTTTHLDEAADDPTQARAELEAMANAINTLITHLSDPSNLIPVGIIAMWHGAIADIPTGWALCNGASGTPDLRSKFIVGATGQTAGADPINTTGGSENITPTGNLGITIGGHALTVAEMPAHDHRVQSAQAGPVGTDGNIGLLNAGAAGIAGHQGAGALTAASGNGTDVMEETGSGNAHTHNVTGASFTGVAHTNRPPYRSLAYIMRIA